MEAGKPPLLADKIDRLLETRATRNAIDDAVRHAAPRASDFNRKNAEYSANLWATSHALSDALAAPTKSVVVTPIEEAALEVFLALSLPPGVSEGDPRLDAANKLVVMLATSNSFRATPGSQLANARGDQLTNITGAAQALQGLNDSIASSNPDAKDNAKDNQKTFDKFFQKHMNTYASPQKQQPVKPSEHVSDILAKTKKVAGYAADGVQVVAKKVDREAKVIGLGFGVMAGDARKTAQ